MGRVIAAALAALLAAQAPVYAAGPDGPPKLQTTLERRLWRALVKCEGAVATATTGTARCLDKLALRQPDVINKLVVPEPTTAAEPDGVSWGWVVAIGVGALGLGAALGAALAGEPSVTVVR